MTRLTVLMLAFFALALITLPAVAAQEGRVTGTVDGQTLDVAIDCSNWGDQSFPNISATDQNIILNATRFSDGKFAFTWKPADYRYQLLFTDVGEPTPTFELTKTFNSKKLGRSFDADITIDCQG